MALDKEVYLHVYETVRGTRQEVGRYLTFYNQFTPHRALDRCTSDCVYWEHAPALPTAE